MQKTKEVPISVKGIGSREKQNVTDAIENIVNDECDDVVSDDIKCQELKREQNVSQELTLCIFCGLPGEIFQHPLQNFLTMSSITSEI